MPIFFSWPDYQQHVVKTLLPQLSSAQLDTEDFLRHPLDMWTWLFIKQVQVLQGLCYLCYTPASGYTEAKVPGV